MKHIILLVTVALLMTVFASVAQAQPAEEAPVGPGGHRHHVNTPSGCIDINAVLFEGGTRGLHQGSEASGLAQGPYHGPCQ